MTIVLITSICGGEELRHDYCFDHFNLWGGGEELAAETTTKVVSGRWDRGGGGGKGL